MMAKGRSVALWVHTSSVLCLLANVNRDPKKKSSPYKPSDFDPHARPAEDSTVIPKIKMRDLKGLVPALAELAKQSQQRTPIQTERIHGR